MNQIDDFLCARAWSRARRGPGMQCFGRIWIQDLLGGLGDVAWTITGPWKQWGLAKHIAYNEK